LVIRLRDHFPVAELVFDAWKLFEIWIGTLVLGGLLRWGFWRGQEIEGCGMASICLTNEATSTDPSRGWPAFAGWLSSGDFSNRCASSTSSLEKEQGENSKLIPAFTLFSILLSTPYIFMEVPHAT
jgi:hypothetical protein